ncbi:hypothetical protein [Mycobacteroides abscessus]|uniref:hypothetical protein n=1 Tax=Mycobacteroides abscessus TaxID=36809 RepID=UPI00092C384B|nr:hypothetical protein [Mycobacteroides abscessus]SHQ48765.1 Uncharacterised protein [Mycobacteroides abscessus subsp. abscessus]SKQ85108.1 Uncharacterised protein [Mycobacteroides abscessus subsp. massiliense]SLC49236.1 Uncharacterised protein [Mycobacteroides abscessus subsp. massiliense]
MSNNKPADPRIAAMIVRQVEMAGFETVTYEGVVYTRDEVLAWGEDETTTTDWGSSVPEVGERIMAALAFGGGDRAAYFATVTGVKGNTVNLMVERSGSTFPVSGVRVGNTYRLKPAEHLAPIESK